MECGSFSISSICEKQYAFYIVRKLTVTNKKVYFLILFVSCIQNLDMIKTYRVLLIYHVLTLWKRCRLHFNIQIYQIKKNPNRIYLHNSIVYVNDLLRVLHAREIFINCMKNVQSTNQVKNGYHVGGNIV